MQRTITRFYDPLVS